MITMDCRQAQTWLLQADDPRAERCGSPAVGEHIRHCDVCGLLAEKVRRLEQAWRALPGPADAERARAAFLKRWPRRPAATPRTRRSLLRRVGPPRWAVAALILVALGFGLWALFPVHEAQASSDVVE